MRKGSKISEEHRMKLKASALRPERLKVAVNNLPRHPKGYNSGPENPRWKGGLSTTYTRKHPPVPKKETCEICGDEGIICYDHDHRTGKFRGWICRSCNLAIGFVREDVIILEKIKNYLLRHAN